MHLWDYFFSFFAARLRKDLDIWEVNIFSSVVMMGTAYLGWGKRPPAIWGTLNPNCGHLDQNPK